MKDKTEICCFSHCNLNLMHPIIFMRKAKLHMFKKMDVIYINYYSFTKNCKNLLLEKHISIYFSGFHIWISWFCRFGLSQWLEWEIWGVWGYFGDDSVEILEATALLLFHLGLKSLWFSLMFWVSEVWIWVTLIFQSRFLTYLL